MKKLLLSTALVAAASMPVFAQDADNVFRQEVNPTEIHASDFIGMRVYRADAVDAEEYEGVQDNWDDIGEINDVVFSRNGTVEAVLVDIGGFLGIGENQVAVDMDAIRFVSDSATVDQETDFFLVLNAPRGSLESAPAYDRAMGGRAAATEGQVAATDEQTADATDSADVTEDTAADTGTAMTDTATDTAAVGTTDTQTMGTGLAREGYVTAPHGELAVDDLTGATAYDVNDERVGSVSDLLVSEDGKIQAAIVDIGGFLGLGAKPVALELSKLDILRAEGGGDVRVYISMTEEELEALPAYEN